jgi:Ca2+-binding RTX toxin-like protein
MVWSSFATGGNDIWLQRLRADGSAIGAPAKINITVKTDFQRDPDIAGLVGGGFAVAWEDANGDDVRASVYGANGKLVRGDFLVNVTTTGTQDDVAIAGLNNGGFVVVWTDANSDIAARVFNSKGVAVTAEIPVNTLTTGSQDLPDVVGLANGGFAVVWEDSNSTYGDGDNILIRLFDQAGNAIGGDQVVNTTLDDDQQAPVITQLEGGRLAVAWESNDTTAPVTTVQDDVRAQILELDGGAILGSSAANTMVGFSTADDLQGLGGNDAISGLNGDDDITGGAGRDIMTGGLGADTFIFELVTDTGNAKTTRDLIADFQHLTDEIDLSAIDANGNAGDGDTAFSFLSAKGAKFTGVEGQLRWVQTNLKGKAKDLTVIQGDVDGNKIADFQITIKGLKIVSLDDLVL